VRGVKGHGPFSRLLRAWAAEVPPALSGSLARGAAAADGLWPWSSEEEEEPGGPGHVWTLSRPMSHRAQDRWDADWRVSDVNFLVRSALLGPRWAAPASEGGSGQGAGSAGPRGRHMRRSRRNRRAAVGAGAQGAAGDAHEEEGADAPWSDDFPPVPFEICRNDDTS
jgi:hypothetical protein